ncbi:MAG: recombinase family protein [Clostridia bacterium]|nr:recombinase family protein [Clostridia bacterium]
MRLNEHDMINIIGKMQDKGSMIPACGYCRFSSDLQREESIEAQMRAIVEYASKNGYKIVEWFCDRAVSGKTVNRPEFQRMLDKIGTRDCPFEAVLIHKMDRFSRNAADALRYKDILRDYSIELVSTVEKIRDDANGRLLYGIMSNINQYYIDNLATEVLKGMKENAFKCQWCGGKPPLGYDVDLVTKKLVINENEAIVVRKIFELSAEGYGYNKIIQELNNRGYKTKAGNPFGKNSLYDLIQNERYYGVYIFNQRAKRTSSGTRNMRKHKDESEIIRIEGGNPAIVSKELWDRANASRRISAKLSTNARYEYILTGLIHCGECGRKMCGNRRYGSTKSYLTYRCNKSSNNLDCKCKEVHADILESFVIDNLMKHFFDPKIIDIITEQVNRKIKDITSKENEFVVDARNALKGLNLAKNNLVEAIAHTGYNPTIGDKIESIEKQISEYQSIIDESEKGKEEISISREEVETKIKQLREDILQRKHVDLTKIMLHQYLDDIVIDNHSIQVTYKVTFSVVIDGKEVEIPYQHIVKEARKKLQKVA